VSNCKSGPVGASEIPRGLQAFIFLAARIADKMAPFKKEGASVRTEKKICEKWVRRWPRSVFHVKDQKHLLQSELNAPGIYILNDGKQPYYVGKAQNLYKRLCDYLNPDLSSYGSWDNFSTFFVRDSKTRDQLEAVLIAAMPTANRARPKIKRVRLPKKLQSRQARGQGA